MSKVLDINQAQTLPAHHPSQWTLVIPAAGRGSRMQYEGPKVLFPLLGKPILDWHLEKLSGMFHEIIIVVSPAHEKIIQEKLLAKTILNEKIFDPKCKLSTVIQQIPLGMADAVECAKPLVSTKFCTVMWGDQVCLSRNTIESALRAHEFGRTYSLTLPTVHRTNPYIHFVRNRHGEKTGEIIKVEQKRENEISVKEGESDCGVFMFRSESLFKVLQVGRKNGQSKGAETKEFNLLPLIPLFNSEGDGIQTLRGISEIETLGVNDPNDAIQAEKALVLLNQL